MEPTYIFPSAAESAQLSLTAKAVRRLGPVMQYVLHEIHRAREQGLHEVSIDGDLSDDIMAALRAKGYRVEEISEGRTVVEIGWPEALSIRPRDGSGKMWAFKPATESGGTFFQALVLLAFVGVSLFGLVNVTLDRLASAAVAAQHSLASMTTATFAAICLALALGWLVTVALAWLTAATWEHERHLRLSKRVNRARKLAPQAESRFTKFTLTPADQAPLKHS
jgi:hypothetical protein